MRRPVGYVVFTRYHPVWFCVGLFEGKLAFLVLKGHQHENRCAILGVSLKKGHPLSAIKLFGFVGPSQVTARTTQLVFQVRDILV